MLHNAKREGYETKKVVCEMNESHKKTTKVRVRKKVTKRKQEDKVKNKDDDDVEDPSVFEIPRVHDRNYGLVS